MAAIYDGAIRKLVKDYKFNRVRAAYAPLASAMADTLPYFAHDILVVPVPTAYRRVRQRGYDQAKLLAREIARQKGWSTQAALRRQHGHRQVGASRAARFSQASQAFECTGDVAGRHILLVDDVTTSGATLHAAAAILVAAGALSVNAVVAAKHTFE